MNNKDKKQTTVTHLPKIIQNKESRNRTGGISTAKYQIGSELGRGGFALCYRGTNTLTKKQYAIKIIDKHSQSMKKSGARQRLTNQIVLMSRLKHQNVAKLIQSFDDEHNYYLVLQLCNKISLSQMLRRRTKVTQIQAKYYTRQLILAVLYLKQSRVIHRDIKTPNILLDDNLVVKLGDFGLAVSADSTDPQRNCVCGTPSFMAPQVTRKQKYSFEVDMWSVGVVIFILLFGTTPFVVNSSKKMSDQQKIDYKYQFPTVIKNRVSDTAKNFISRIFLIDPKLRMTPEQAICHQFLTQSVPSQLPFQCYHRQVSSRQIQLFIVKPQKIAIAKHVTKNREHNTNKNNRTITSYFNRTVSDKNIKTAKKQNNTNKDDILTEKSTQKNNQKQLKKSQIQLFQIKIEPHAPACSISNGKLDDKFKSESQKQQIVSQKPFFEQILNKQQQNGQKLQSQPIIPATNPEISHLYHEQENSGANQQQIINQNNVNIYEWLDQKLQQPYIYEFKDFSEKFGFCYHLSNGVKVSIFNDKTIMAISQINRKVVYFSPIDKNFQYCERLLYKLIRVSPLDQCNANSQPNHQYILQKQKENKIIQKQPRQDKKSSYKILQFKTHEVPNSTDIAKKYFILRQYCRKCNKRKPQIYRKYQNVDLIKCVKMLIKWGCKKKSQEYIFITHFFIQVMFPDGTSYFINKNKPQFYITNQFQKVMKIIQLPLRKKKALSKKHKFQFEIVQKFLIYFINRKKQENYLKQQLKLQNN